MGGGDTEEGIFCLPDLTDRFVQGTSSTSSSLGTIKSSGLPEIYGKAHFDPFKDNKLSLWGVEGCITNPIESVSIASYSNAGTVNQATVFYMYASLYNEIYGSSDTVQPPSILLRFLIKYI